MIMGVDGDSLFRLDTANPHPAGDALTESARFSVGIASVPVEDRDPVGVKVRALVKIVDRSHRCLLAVGEPGVADRATSAMDGRNARPSTNYDDIFALDRPCVSKTPRISRWPKACVADTKPTARGAP